ncbi:MAG TPA: CAP domain-containing protein [Longimicrobiales bacterium]|nr:CAP domain-containing protein [Longimicrobiales bacterium]
MKRPSVTRRAAALIMLVAVQLPGCGVYVLPANPEVAPAREIASLDEALARHIEGAGNRARARAGVVALEADAALSAAARDFAVELARRDELSHTSRRRGYETVTQRVARVEPGMYRVAENLAKVPGRSDVAEEVVRRWLGSRGHRTNLLNGAYSLVGTGVAAGAERTWYVVQVYGGRAPPSPRGTH